MNPLLTSLNLSAITVIASISLASQQAHSATFIYESFSQPAGSLNGQAGGTGLNTWGDNQTVDVVTPTTLSYGDLTNTGGQVNLLSGSGVDAFVTTTTALSTNGLLDDGATLWFSFMYSKTSSGGGSNEKGGFAFGTAPIDGAFNGTNMAGNGIGARILATGINAGTWSGSGNVTAGTGTSIALNTSYLVVGRIQWGATAGDDETITLYLQDTSNLGTLSASIGTATMTGVDQSLFDTISMTQRGSGGTVTYDEIRFGETFADVTPAAAPIPEPSSTALIGLGGLAFILRRRR